MPATFRRPLYTNPSAATWTAPPPTADSSCAKFHKSLPGYKPTSLIPLDAVARQAGVENVFLKDESSRLGLPSFKILGASWATHRAVAAKCRLELGASVEEVGLAAREHGVKLYAATDGNHGRAIGRVAKLLGIRAQIYVPRDLDLYTRSLITSEGAQVVLGSGDYDEAVRQAARSAAADYDGILVQDTAWDGYEEIPHWIVEGYSTMMSEIDDQLHGIPPDLIVVPVGVGSFAQAVVTHSKSPGRNTTVLAVEPDTAACLRKSLACRRVVSIDTSQTIMSGMNCGTVSSIAWQILQSGVDASCTISDHEAHEAVQLLKSLGIAVGPCGAATLAAFQIAMQNDPEALKLNADSTVVLLCTEGARDYVTPVDVSFSTTVEITQQLVRIDSSNPDLSSQNGAGETQIARYITAWLEHRDIEAHTVEEVKGRPSVVGVVKGTGGGKSIMLNGHIDTVTTAGYRGDPLSGHIKDGKLHGRGAADMKCGVAAALAAAERVRRSRVRGDVIVAAVADEEYMSIGTEQVLAAGWTADGAIVSEPTNLAVLLSHKGFIWLEIDVIGKAAHGSTFGVGIDAIVKTGHFLVKLDQYCQDLQSRAGHATLGKAVAHASLITGGEEPSSYPAKCTITVERRTLPGETAETAEKELRNILEEIASVDKDFHFELRIIAKQPAFEIDKADFFVQCALRGIEAVLERAPSVEGGAFWTDCALLQGKGIPAILFGPVGVGLHGDTEWVEIRSIEKVADALTNIIRSFCA